MSDRFVQSYDDCDARTGQSMHSYQSVWMAHWTRSSCNAAPQMLSPLSRSCGNKGDDHDTNQHHLPSGVEITSAISRSAKGFRDAEARTFEIMNESLIMSLKNMRNEGSGCQFQLVSHCQPGGVSRNPAELAKASASHIGPQRFNHRQYGFHSGRTAVPSFICRQEETNQRSSILASNEHLSNANLMILEQEHSNYYSHSAFLVSERKMDDCSNAGKSVIPYLRQNDASLLLNDPSTSNNYSPVVYGEQYQRMQNSSNIGLFPSWSSPPEMKKLEKLHHGPQHSVHNVATMKICTPVEGLAGGPPRFSQTTRSLLVTTKTDVNLCKENQIFRELRARVSTQLQGNAFNDLHSLSPFFGHGQQGVKLQTLSSFTDNAGEENAEDYKACEDVPKNESSAETDTMDYDTFRANNHLSGVNSSPSHEDIMVDLNLPPQATIPSAGEEVGCRRYITMLPDINLEPPASEPTALPASESSMDNAEPSTSRTQSLDMELFLPPAEQPGNSISNNCRDGPEPSSRWVKHLKLGGLDSFALGTKSSKLGKPSSHENASKFFSRITEDCITSSKSLSSKHHGKELIVLDHTTSLLRNDESSSANTAKKDMEITLSHPWIQRWRHNQGATLGNKSEAVMDCDPQSSNVALEDFQKKKFPSIGAMALMGKAMSGFQPCEFRKMGSFVVWNTKGF